MKQHASHKPPYKLHKYLEYDMTLVVFELDRLVKKHFTNLNQNLGLCHAKTWEPLQLMAQQIL